MRKDLNLENFYSCNAWDYDRALQRANEVLSSYDDKNPPTDISHVLELYNLHQLLKGNARQVHLDNFDASKFKTLSKSFMALVAKFYNNITAENILAYAESDSTYLLCPSA